MKYEQNCKNPISKPEQSTFESWMKVDLPKPKALDEDINDEFT